MSYSLVFAWIYVVARAIFAISTYQVVCLFLDLAREANNYYQVPHCTDQDLISEQDTLQDALFAFLF